MKLILSATDFGEHAQLMGGKAKALADLSQANFPIPEWFVLSPQAFTLSLSKTQKTALTNCDDFETIQTILKDIDLSSSVKKALSEAIKDLYIESAFVAVRSSAADEDGAEHSFAGQLDSFLFVKAEDVLARIKDVWRSGFSERVLTYRKEAKLPFLPTAPAVLVQRMVNADVSGVAFGADPITGKRSVRLVSAVYGLGSALVSGDSDADTYFVAREGHVLEQSIASKKTAHRQDDKATEGVSHVAVDAELTDKPALIEEQVKQIAKLVQQSSEHFARPQDIEWAIENNELYLLQSRPITSLFNMSDPDGVLGIWDNSNIVESYGGVTTPLTFSFALYAYEGVYRELLRILGVSKQKRLEQENTFKHMLGLIRGRIYYNLLSWYKLLATLPGFNLNQAFMEQMMGVKEGLPEEVLAGLKGSQSSKLKDGFDVGIAVLKLMRAYQKLPKDINKFYNRLNTALGTPKVALSEMRPDELVEHYRDLEAKLLSHWDAPLVNDFFAMIFYGVLSRLCQNWAKDEEGSLQNNLVSDQGGMISAEPAKRVKEMALLASTDLVFTKLLQEGALVDIQKAMPSEFKKAYEAYLEKFGDRCLEELKLESATLNDDPSLLLRSLGSLAGHPERLQQSATSPEDSLRARAEQRIQESIKNPFRRTIFNWVLKQARARVRDRENLRFERTRLFGRIRKLFLELGKRFYALGLLEDPRDIFYLELNESLALVEGTSTLTKIKDLVALRKAEFECYQQEEAPDERFDTRGLVYQGNRFKHTGEREELDLSGDTRKGIACCPGIVRGHVTVVTDPRNANMTVGNILVAKQTDPGWIMLFPAASGLLVERGSLLSHSAIVAREMSIPAIVSIPNVTEWLTTGDFVEFDGSTGMVKKILEDEHV